jgi:excisionase family DNA binding protein
MEADPLSDGLMTIEEACDFAKVSRSSLYVLLQRHQITSVKLGKSRRVVKTALIAFLRDHIVPPSQGRE